MSIRSGGLTEIAGVDIDGGWTTRPASADKTARSQFQFQFQYLCISRVHLFYYIQWKRIRGIPFILIVQTQQIKMHVLNQVQVNLIYNTNRNLFLWIEIFISTTDLYNATAGRWSCQLPNRNVCATDVLPIGVDPFVFRYQGNGATPANILIPLESQLIALQLRRW